MGSPEVTLISSPHSHLKLSQALCRLNDALRVFEEMASAGITPELRAYTTLLEACKRANHPEYAQHLVFEVMPAAGVEPDVHAWNTLLGAYGRNGNIDGAYLIWRVRAPVVI